mgnify:CR=1 FL=1
MLCMFDFETSYRQLRPSERIFVDGYVSELERYAARNSLKLKQAIQSYNADNLDEQSKSILSQALVRAAITERVRELSEDAELSVFKTLKELRSMAYSNLGNYMEVDGFGVPMFNLDKCTPEQLAAIKTVKIKENPNGERQFEFTLHDKVQAMSLMMKYQGLLDAEAWRVENAKENQQKTISAGSTVDDAADMYARQING